MKVYDKDGWKWIKNVKVSQKNITGKYLFFSANKRSLVALAKLLLDKYKLPKAKVPSGKSINKDGSFVLCVYDTEPKLKYELRQFADEVNIRYRYWKSDEDTYAGHYSDQFRGLTYRIVPKEQ